MRERALRALARPAGWLLFQVAQLFVLGLAIRFLIPAGWSRAVKLAVVGPVLVVIVIVNYRIRRSLPPFFEVPSRRQER